MGVRAHLLVVLCILVAGTSTAQLFPPPPVLPPRGTAPQPKPPPFGRAMTMVITVVSAAIGVLFLLLFFCAYVSQCRLVEDHDAAQAGSVAPGGVSSWRGNRGLDPAVVATFPIVPYREIKEHKIGSGALECAVCLTEFEDTDDLRLLPHCSHAFHPECIDPWLETRTTCPLCRANLEKPPPPAAAPAPPLTPQAVVAIPVREEIDVDVDARKEEAIELEKLRMERRAARLLRSHSTGHSAEQCDCEDHERFTLRLPQHVREEVLSRCCARPAAESMSGGGCAVGERRCSFRDDAGGVGDCSRGERRWQAFLGPSRVDAEGAG